MNTRTQRRNHRGFSLVELIIVIAIMAILAGALAPALIRYIGKSRRTTDIRSAGELQAALQRALARSEFESPNSNLVVVIRKGDTADSSASDIRDELLIELSNNVPAIKSFPDYYWYIIYNGSSGSVPEVHLTDSPSGEPIYELYPDNYDFIEMNDDN